MMKFYNLLCRNYMGFLNKYPGLKRFGILCFMLFVSLMISASLYISHSYSQVGFDRNQTLLVDIVSEEILAGKLYKNNSMEAPVPSCSDGYLSKDNLKKNRIVIIVADLGLNKSPTLEALSLP